MSLNKITVGCWVIALLGPCFYLAFPTSLLGAEMVWMTLFFFAFPNTMWAGWPSEAFALNGLSGRQDKLIHAIAVGCQIFICAAITLVTTRFAPQPGAFGLPALLGLMAVLAALGVLAARRMQDVETLLDLQPSSMTSLILAFTILPYGMYYLNRRIEHFDQAATFA